MRSLSWLTQVASVVGKKSSGGNRWFVTIVCQAWVRVSAHAVHTQLICLVQAETKNLIDTIRLRLRKVPPKIGLPVTTAKRMHYETIRQQALGVMPLVGVKGWGVLALLPSVHSEKLPPTSSMSSTAAYRTQEAVHLQSHKIIS